MDEKETLFGAKQAISAKARKIQCQVTGLPARYRDPKTGGHYHDTRAYRVLQTVAEGEYEWSELFGMYPGKAVKAKGVPDWF
jgi:vacuolar protein sorting-associated protein 72